MGTNTLDATAGPASMTLTEALAALRLLVERADAMVPSARGTKWPVYTEAEVAAAKTALEVLGDGSTVPLARRSGEAT